MSNVKTVNGYKVADGDLRNNVAPEFDQSNAYNVGDIVFHENQLYKCTTATTADADWNSTQWSTTNLAEIIELLRDYSAEFIVESVSAESIFVPANFSYRDFIIPATYSGTEPGFVPVAIVGYSLDPVDIIAPQAYLTYDPDDGWEIHGIVINTSNTAIYEGVVTLQVLYKRKPAI